MAATLDRYEGFGYANPVWGEKCPIELHEIITAMFEGRFRPFTEQDWMAFAGCEYTPYAWEPKTDHPPGYEIIVIADHGPGGVHLEVNAATPEGDSHVWAAELGSQAGPAADSEWRKVHSPE